MKKKYFYLFACLLLSIPLTPLAGQAALGAVWFDPGTSRVQPGADFLTDIYVNTGDKKVSALGLDITFDPAALQCGSITGLLFESPYTDIVRVAIAPENPGNINISGFIVEGVGPSVILKLGTIHWQAKVPGTYKIDLQVNTLTDGSYATIGTPKGIAGQVVVAADTLIGDVNTNGVVNIVDALMIAQYVVGINPQGFNAAAADVNCDGTVNIIDALRLAQYVVDVVLSLGC